MSYNQNQNGYPGVAPYGQQMQPQPYGQQMQPQPMGNPGMSMSQGPSRNPTGRQMNKQGKRPWAHGLCDCFGDCGTCCIACWCPCISYGQNRSRMRHLEQSGRPHPEGGDAIGSDCLIYGLLTAITGLGCILQIMSRGQERDRYMISGNGCGDCCTVCWCTPCALTQESRELEEEEKFLNQSGGGY